MVAFDQRSFFIGAALSGVAARASGPRDAGRIAKEAIEIADATIAAITPPPVDLAPSTPGTSEKTINFDE